MTINVVNIRASLPDTINRVAYQGERVVLEARATMRVEIVQQPLDLLTRPHLTL